MSTGPRTEKASALVTIVLCALSASGVGAQELSVVNARLVAGDDSKTLGPVTIVISNGRIASIASTGTAPDTSISWIDAEGLFVVPGRAERLGPSPEPTSLDWREEMLVRLSNGVTTLVAPKAAIEDARRLLPADYPAARLLQASAAGGDAATGPLPSAPLEVGAEAAFLILEEDPRPDPTAATRPLAAIVGTRVHSRDLLAVEARILSEERQIELYQGLMPQRLLGPSGRSGLEPWPRSCEAGGDDECLGPDPACALKYELLTRSTHGRTCLDPLAGERRQRLLRSLGRLATVAPADERIVGQRVNLALIEQDFDRALEVAEGCTSEPWWCRALRGLVLHTRSPGAGGAAFDSALSTVPEDTPAWRDPPLPASGDRGVRCEWRDVAYLIADPSLRDEYAARPCGERTEFEERFWWLADPLWSEPGNARRDEHFARNVRAKFRDEILGVNLRYPNWMHAHCDVRLADWVVENGPSEQVRCRSSHADWVRFGSPDSWRGVEYRLNEGFLFGADGKLITPDGERCQSIKNTFWCVAFTEPQLREAFLSGGYGFVPTSTVFSTPEASTPTDWSLARGEGHERMKTEATWYNLDQQTAVLRRGDSLSVVSAAAFPTLLSSLDEVEGALALGRVSDREVLLHPAEVDESTGVFRTEAMVEDAARVVSLESSGPDVRGRSRLGAIAPVLVDGFGISKPLLVRGEFDPETDDLLEAMVPSTALPRNGGAGLYIELYGVEAGQQVRMTLTYELGEVRRSFFGRIASALGIGGGPSGPVSVEWTEQLENVQDGVGSVVVAADLGDLPDGEVEISVAAVLGERTASTATTFKSRQGLLRRNGAYTRSVNRPG